VVFSRLPVTCRITRPLRLGVTLNAAPHIVPGLVVVVEPAVLKAGLWAAPGVVETRAADAPWLARGRPAVPRAVEVIAADAPSLTSTRRAVGPLSASALMVIRPVERVMLMGVNRVAPASE